jgi:hypothetical protein
LGGYLYEYKYLGGDEKFAHYYLKELPQWLQGSYGYNYLALGVLLSLITIVGVSLATRKCTAERLAFVRMQPVDDVAQFERACALVSEPNELQPK